MDSKGLLQVLLDAWDRNNTIMVNLLEAIPAGGLDARATPSSATIAQQFWHLHHERLISVFEEAPEHAIEVPREEWPTEADRHELARRLAESARVVRAAVEARVLEDRGLELHYDHPVLLLQLLLWHEAYHHGQIKLALKLAGLPVSDDVAGPLTWDIWRQRRGAARA